MSWRRASAFETKPAPLSTCPGPRPLQAFSASSQGVKIKEVPTLYTFSEKYTHTGHPFPSTAEKVPALGDFAGFCG